MSVTAGAVTFGTTARMILTRMFTMMFSFYVLPSISSLGEWWKKSNTG